MRRTALSTLLTIALAAALASSCGEESRDGSSEPSGETGPGDAGSDGPEGGPMDGELPDGESPDVPEDTGNGGIVYPANPVRVVFTRQERYNPTGQKTQDLYITEILDPGRLEEIHRSSNKKAKVTNLSDGDFSCPVGCPINAGQTHLIYLNTDDTPWTLWAAPIAKVGEDWSVEVINNRQVTHGELLGFGWAGPARIHYAISSGPGETSGLNIFLQDLGGENNIQVAQNPGNGFYRVDPSGRFMVLLRTTLDAMSVSVLAISRLAEGEYSIHTFGGNTGTGSEFSGKEPLAFSPDGTKVAIFTTFRPSPAEPPEFRLSIFDIDPDLSQEQPRMLDNYLLGPGGQGACDRRLEGQHIAAAQNPIWSPDGKAIYFLAEAREGRVPCQTPGMNKKETDIVRIGLNDDFSVDRDGIVNISSNPRDDNAFEMEHLTLTPSGDGMVVTGVPSNTRNTELYILSSEVTDFRRQLNKLTKDISYDVRYPVSLRVLD